MQDYLSLDGEEVLVVWINRYMEIGILSLVSDPHPFFYHEDLRHIILLCLYNCLFGQEFQDFCGCLGIALW